MSRNSLGCSSANHGGVPRKDKDPGQGKQSNRNQRLETRKRELIVAVHHRQYPSLFMGRRAVK